MITRIAAAIFLLSLGAALIDRIMVSIFTCLSTEQDCVNGSLRHFTLVVLYGVPHVISAVADKLEVLPKIISVLDTVVRSFTSN